MAKHTVILCDICEENKAITKCFICEKDICNEHNFGGESSKVLIGAYVYNDKVFNILLKDPFIDCCSDCTDILKLIKIENLEIFENELRDHLDKIKEFLLKEIKKNSKR
jgi:hypothetical protein